MDPTAARYMDVHLELDATGMAREGKPTRIAAELSRRAAEDQAAAAGVKLRHGDPIDLLVKGATSPMGNDVVLVATRWVIDPN